MSDNRPTFADIKAELIERLPQLCRELLPDGKKSGNYWLCSSPGVKNKTPNMWVRLDSGAWRDEPVAQGDVIKLVIYVEGLADNKTAYQWCLDWLGWGQGIDRAKLERRRRQVQQRQAQDERETQEEIARNRKRAFGSFLHGQKAWQGTPLETYLREARGINLTVLQRQLGSIRFYPQAQHIDTDGVITEWPMMVAAIYHAAHGVVAIHRTWLAEDGSGKAPVSPNKKIWPAGWAGGVIRLWKGLPRLNPEQAAAKGMASPCIIAEGIETGLSLACADPTMRVWAAATMGNMENVPDHDCVSGWLLAHDRLKPSLNDEQRKRHLDKLAEIKRHFQATGKPVAELWPSRDDFNDELRQS